MSATGILRNPGEGERRWFFGGGTHTWKVTAEQSDGALFLFEDEMTQGKMTPWHCHPHTDEVVYVIEGEILINIDGEERHLTAGGVSMAPRGVPHAFTVISERVRLLAFQTPGTSQTFYWDGSVPAQTDGDGPVDFAALAALAQSSGVTTLMGPPPFVSSV